MPSGSDGSVLPRTSISYQTVIQRAPVIVNEYQRDVGGGNRARSAWGAGRAGGAVAPPW